MRREALVVSGCSTVVAASSLVFYSILTAQTDVTLMASFIAAQAIAGIVQIAFVPNGMIFVYSAGTRNRRNDNVFYAVSFELIGFALGAALLAVAVTPLHIGAAVFIAFIGFGMAGSTSCLGHIRSENRWFFYTVSFLLPSIGRLALVLVDLAGGSIPSQLYDIMVRYFLWPETLRYLIVVPPIFLRNLRIPRWQRAKRAFRLLFHNYVYDLGSAVVEVGDRLILSAIVSPTLLVVYYFSRRLGTATIVVLEPFYAIEFKRFANSKFGSYTSRDLAGVLTKGYLIGATIAVFVWCILTFVMFWVPAAMHFIPSFVIDFRVTFAALIIIDSVIAANRWSRYLTLLDGRTLALLSWRLICLAVFLSITWCWPFETEALGLVLGFFCFALAEYIFISLRVRHIGLRSVRH
jgi:hypothetical protein